MRCNSSKPINTLRLNLLMSCFVTHNRKKIQGDRLKEFIATIHSYGKIKFEKVFLFIKIDTDISLYKDEIEGIARASLDYKKIHIIFDRIIAKTDWQNFFSGQIDGGDLWWFTQNDDHVYINNDRDYFEYLLTRLNSTSGPASIYLSHWPEILRLASNQKSLKLINGVAEFRGVLLDSIQIFNESMLKFIFYKLDWPSETMNRIDTVGVSDNIIPTGIISSVSGELPSILVPLKELCRKFRGYDHVGLEYPAKLRFLPAVMPVQLDKESLLKYVTANHFSSWVGDNNSSVSSDILQELLLVNGDNLNLNAQKLKHDEFYLKIYKFIRRKSYYLRNISLFVERALLSLHHFLNLIVLKRK